VLPVCSPVVREGVSLGGDPPQGIFLFPYQPKFAMMPNMKQFLWYAMQLSIVVGVFWVFEYWTKPSVVAKGEYWPGPHVSAFIGIFLAFAVTLLITGLSDLSRWWKARGHRRVHKSRG
jgi:hypothetical protein